MALHAVTPHQKIMAAAQEYGEGVLSKVIGEYDLARRRDVADAVHYISETRRDIAGKFYQEARDWYGKMEELELVATARGLERIFQKHRGAVRYFHREIPAPKSPPTPYEELGLLKSKNTDPVTRMGELIYEIAKLQADMSIHAPKIIPKPRGPAESQKPELVATILVAGAFVGLLTYFLNQPGTTGYASLPNYGITTILLSLVVMTALFFVFRKRG